MLNPTGDSPYRRGAASTSGRPVIPVQDNGERRFRGYVGRRVIDGIPGFEGAAGILGRTLGSDFKVRRLSSPGLRLVTLAAIRAFDRSYSEARDYTVEPENSLVMDVLRLAEGAGHAVSSRRVADTLVGALGSILSRVANRQLSVELQYPMWVSNREMDDAGRSPVWSLVSPIADKDGHLGNEIAVARSLRWTKPRSTAEQPEVPVVHLMTVAALGDAGLSLADLPGPDVLGIRIPPEGQQHKLSVIDRQF